MVSLHWGFANKGVRKKQLDSLRDLVIKAERPIILMGDFNTDMSKPLLPVFLEKAQLKSWKVDDDSIVTFPLLSTRIDWILVSSEFDVVEQTVLGDVLSDHKILTAVIQRVL